MRLPRRTRFSFTRNHRHAGICVLKNSCPGSATMHSTTKDRQRGFVANPAKGSKHNRGCAVDLSMYDLKTGKPKKVLEHWGNTATMSPGEICSETRPAPTTAGVLRARATMAVWLARPPISVA